MPSIIAKTNRAVLRPSEPVLLPTGLLSSEASLTYPEYIRNGTFQCLTNGTNWSITTQPSSHIATGWHLKQFGGSNVTATIVENSSGGVHRVDTNAKKYLKVDINAVGGTSSDYVILEQRCFDLTKYAGEVVMLEFEACANSNRRIAIEFIADESNSPTNSIIPCQLIDLEQGFNKYCVFASIPSPSGEPYGTLHNLKVRFWLAAGSSFTSRLGAGVASGDGEVFISNIRDGSSLTKKGRFEEENACGKYFFNSGKRFFSPVSTTAYTVNCTLHVEYDMAYVPTYPTNFTLTGINNLGAISTQDITQRGINFVSTGTNSSSSARIDNILINIELPE